MSKVKVILKDKEGKIKRTLFYPPKNAAKLVAFKSGWEIAPEIEGKKTKKNTASE